jgi:hypothetical protein
MNNVNVWTRRSDELFEIDRDVVFPVVDVEYWKAFSSDNSNITYDEGAVLDIVTDLTSEELTAWIPFATDFTNLSKHRAYDHRPYDYGEIKTLMRAFQPKDTRWILLTQARTTESFEELGKALRVLSRTYSLKLPPYFDKKLSEADSNVHWNCFIFNDPVKREGLKMTIVNKLLNVREINSIVGIIHSAWMVDQDNAGEVDWDYVEWAELPHSGWVRKLADVAYTSNEYLVEHFSSELIPVALLEALREQAVPATLEPYLNGEISYTYSQHQDRIQNFYVKNWGELYSKILTYLASIEEDRQDKYMGLFPIIYTSPLDPIAGIPLDLLTCTAYTTIQSMTGSIKQEQLSNKLIPGAVKRTIQRLGRNNTLSITGVLLNYAEAGDEKAAIFCNESIKLLEEGEGEDEYQRML